jgi:hypothetical protein
MSDPAAFDLLAEWDAAVALILPEDGSDSQLETLA